MADDLRPRDRLVRVVALVAVPLVLVAVLIVTFTLPLTPEMRFLVVCAGGAVAALALIAPWLLSRS